MNSSGYNLLALVPNLLPHPTSPFRGESCPHRIKLVVHDLEAMAHEIVKVEILLDRVVRRQHFGPG